MNVNFIVKVQDAKAVDLKKALEAAEITVRSIQEVHKEEVAEEESKDGKN